MTKTHGTSSTLSTPRFGWVICKGLEGSEHWIAVPHRTALSQHDPRFKESNFGARGIEETVRAFANGFSCLTVAMRFLEGLADSTGPLPGLTQDHINRSLVAVTPAV